MTGSSLVIESPKKPWWRRWWVIALGVLIVLGIVGAIAGGGGDKDDADATTPGTTGPLPSQQPAEAPSSPSSSAAPSTSEAAASTTTEATTAPPTTVEPVTTAPPTTAPPESGLSLANPAPVGQAVVVGDWTIRVVSVTPDAAEQIAAENQFNEPPAPGNQFFMVSLEATYSGGESSTFWVDMSLKAIGASSVAYEGFDASCGVLPNDLDNAGETFPGGTITGNLCWSINAADASTMAMIADPSFSFDDGNRRFLSLDPAAVPIDDSTSREAPPLQAIEGAPIGQPVQVGDWTITVVSVTPDAAAQVAAENQFNEPPAPGTQFFMATLEATYNGSESSTFWVDMSLKAIGLSSVAYEGFDASCGVLPNDLDNAGETFPGGTVTGNVCWSIDVADAESLTMLAAPSFSFDDQREAFSLTA